MANVNNPYGLKPLMRTLDGGAPQLELWTKAAAYAQALYKWDPVTLVVGFLKGPASGLSAGSTLLLGVNMNLGLISTLTSHNVMTSPHAVYDTQGDGSAGTNVVAGKMGFGANLNYTGTAGGGVTRDNSGVQLTESTITVTSSGGLDVKILNLVNEPDNAFGANGRMEIYINNHLRNPGTTAT